MRRERRERGGKADEQRRPKQCLDLSALSLWLIIAPSVPLPMAAGHH